MLRIEFLLVLRFRSIPGILTGNFSLQSQSGSNQSDVLVPELSIISTDRQNDVQLIWGNLNLPIHFESDLLSGTAIVNGTNLEFSLSKSHSPFLGLDLQSPSLSVHVLLLSMRAFRVVVVYGGLIAAGTYQKELSRWSALFGLTWTPIALLVTLAVLPLGCILVCRRKKDTALPLEKAKAD
jgi:hypothetical protein